jgi:excisionase family DNA binding protein
LTKTTTDNPKPTGQREPEDSQRGPHGSYLRNFRRYEEGVHMGVSLCYDGVMGIEGYLTTKEAAEVLGITQNGVYQHIRRGNIEAIKVGTTLLIPEKELDKIRDAKPGRPPKKSSSTS